LGWLFSEVPTFFIGMNMITIDLLKNYPQHISALAHIWYEVLGKVWLPDVSMHYIQDELIGGWIHEDTLPLAHIAMIDGKVAECASLQENCGMMIRIL
jgi:hypothetical protein